MCVFCWVTLDLDFFIQIIEGFLKMNLSRICAVSCHAETKKIKILANYCTGIGEYFFKNYFFVCQEDYLVFDD